MFLKDIMNIALAIKYAIWGLVLLILSLAGWPWTLLLLWPAAACLWLAAGYAWLGPAVWGRQGNPWRRVLLWPLCKLLCCRQRRQRPDCEPAELAPGIWFGGRLDERQARHWLPAGVAVLDVAPEHSPSWGTSQPAWLAIDMLDGAAPPPMDLLLCELFIDMHRERGVYIHGGRGDSRVALVAATWLLRQHPRLSVEQALQTLQAPHRPLRLNAGQILVLQQVRELQRAG